MNKCQTVSEQIVDLLEMKYPAQIPPEYAHTDYKVNKGEIVHISPKQFLDKVKPLTIDDESRDNIDDLKQHMKSGRLIDPPVIHTDGTKVVSHDGRHRAHAAHELGMKKIPVLVLDKNWVKPARFSDLENQK